MNYKKTRTYLLSKPETLEDFPFGPDVAVFKTHGKMFATLAVENDIARTNLKCDPVEAIQLRDVYDAVQPGYHMNKTHWNTVLLDGSLPDGEIKRMIDMSYGLIVKKLKKAERTRLETLYTDAELYGV